ncbi:MAG TPA: SDR family oxidoreductase [Candidatus Kapabacteria bacterium]|nr:SDR family oxidoreductase [Candidatus Kapabacteria bacterium]
MSKVAVVTGAGSGVGRATVIKLVQQGWSVVLIGRTERTLRETATLTGKPDACTITPLTIGDVSATSQLAAEVLTLFGRVDLLVNAAGTNVPKRSLEVLTMEDYHAMMDSNLNGAFYLVQSFLPMMRRQKAGTIVNIVSDAGRQASPKAGPGYVISKFGMVGLTQAINAEERGNGIRACAILPGDIDTPLLDKRPAPPNAEARTKMLQPEDVADCVLLAVNLPDRAVVEELLIRPR